MYNIIIMEAGMRKLVNFWKKKKTRGTKLQANVLNRKTARVS
jgi:hypothetical protein